MRNKCASHSTVLKRSSFALSVFTFPLLFWVVTLAMLSSRISTCRGFVASFGRGRMGLSTGSVSGYAEVLAMATTNAQSKRRTGSGSKRIVISASDVSAIIGENPFKSPEDVLETLWGKYSTETKSFQTDAEKAVEVIEREKTGEMKQIFTEAVNQAKLSLSSQEAMSNLTKAVSKIDKIVGLTDEEKALTKELVRSTVSTQYGTHSEDRAADQAQEKVVDKGVRLIEVSDFFSLPVLRSDMYRFEIVGRIDRLEVHPDGNVVLIEIKNRMKRLFREVRSYEYVQIQVYLKLLGLKRAKLIEKFDDEIHEEEVSFDSEFFEEVVSKRVYSFAERFQRILSDPVERERYSAEREADKKGLPL